MIQGLYSTSQSSMQWFTLVHGSPRSTPVLSPARITNRNIWTMILKFDPEVKVTKSFFFNQLFTVLRMKLTTATYNIELIKLYEFLYVENVNKGFKYSKIVRIFGVKKWWKYPFFFQNLPDFGEMETF